MCADRQRVAGERDRGPELIEGIGVGRFNIGLLRPDPGSPSENIDGAGAIGIGVALIAIDPSRGAVLPRRADRQRVARERDRRAEKNVGSGVRRFNIRLLRPDPGSACEHINGAGACDTAVALITIDAGRAAVIEAADRERVTRERERDAKRIVGTGVRRFDIGLL